MNILFLLGNGFDINLDLKTSYKSFLKFYLEQESDNELIKNLKMNIKSVHDKWSDLELRLGEYSSDVKTFEEFEIVFEDIEDRLAEYLQLEEDKFDVDSIDASKLKEYLLNPEKSLLQADVNNLNQFKRRFSGSTTVISIVTFNYTKIIEKILGDYKIGTPINTNSGTQMIINDVEHIHGYIYDRMVMGVNDTSQIANSSFHDNQDALETLVKSHCNQASKHTIDDKLKSLLNSANIICVFGSSLGQTDKMWWQLIGRRLLLDDCKLIIFDYRNADLSRRTHKIGRLEREKRSHFLGMTDLNNDEKQIASSNIFIGINSKMLDIKK